VWVQVVAGVTLLVVLGVMCVVQYSAVLAVSESTAAVAAVSVVYALSMLGAFRVARWVLLLGVRRRRVLHVQAESLRWVDGDE
jgi:hypothetical protein